MIFSLRLSAVEITDVWVGARGPGRAHVFVNVSWLQGKTPDP